MILEEVEQRVLEYLMQVNRPLVPLDQLMRHLNRFEELQGVNEEQVLEFLRKHELFTVLDPIGLAADQSMAKHLLDAGIPVGPSVILATRIPAPEEISTLFNQQFDTLGEYLQKALKEAQEKGKADAARQMIALIDRMNTLKVRFKTALP